MHSSVLHVRRQFSVPIALSCFVFLTSGNLKHASLGRIFVFALPYTKHWRIGPIFAYIYHSLVTIVLDFWVLFFFCLSSYISPLTTSHAIIKIVPQSNSCSKQQISDCCFAENESVILAIKWWGVFCQFCWILMKEWCIIPWGREQKWVVIKLYLQPWTSSHLPRLI